MARSTLNSQQRERSSKPASAAAPKAWNPEYVRRLLGVARAMKGSYHDTRKADFWTAWILVSYETGSRAGELFEIKNNQVEADGGLKGRQLSEPAKAAVKKLLGTRKYLFGRLASRREILREYSALQKKESRR